MVLMALDHTRDFFTNVKFDPLNLERTNVALFLTRWFTHYCAPNFIFLAGVGAFLATTRGKTKAELSWFLFSRGLWLALLEVTWVRCLGWAFNFDFHNIGVGVLWAIGWSMVVLAALIYLPLPEIAAFGVAMIFFHNTLDHLKPDQWGSWSWLWHVLHVPGQMHPAPGWNFAVGYVLVPWMGVMAAGYGFAAIFLWDSERRRKWLLRLGIWLTLLFVLVRWANTYGNPRQWEHQANWLFTIFSFIDCHKYPPSLDYILMTIGPALIVLAWLERGTPAWLKPFLVFGRVPLFYYLLHLPLIHGMAVAVAWLRHGRAGWLFNSPFSAEGAPPADAGFGLVGVYVAWICAVLILYPICCWFADFKRRRKDAWLSYL